MFEQRWLHYLLLAGLMTVAARTLHLAHWRWADFLDNLVLDQSFSHRGAAAPEAVASALPHTRHIMIIKLTHDVPRSKLAMLLDKLGEAKVVAIDLMFVDKARELSDTEKPWYHDELQLWQREDQTLIRAERRLKHPIVIGIWPERLPDPNYPGTLVERPTWQPPPRQLWQATPYHGHLRVEPDPQDGFVRKVHLFQDTPAATPCLGLAVAAAALGLGPRELAQLKPRNGYLQLREHRIPVDADGNIVIDYVGGRECFEAEQNCVVYENVIDGYTPDQFKDKIVFIGQTAFKAKDIFTTPFGDMPGVEVHANVAATLLSKLGPPTPVPLWQATWLALWCSMLLVLPLLRLSLASSLIVAGVEMLLLDLLAVGIFTHSHQILPASVPMVAVVFTYNGIALYEYGRTRSTLGRFIGREMLPRAMGLFARLSLGGRLEEATACFCDLRDYSTLVEHLTPETATAILNEYTRLVERVAHQHQGRVVDYLGDAVFILFESSLAGAQHALKAVQTAVAVQRTYAACQQQPQAAGASHQEVGIAVHTGPMVIGLVGSERNLKLGAVGDAVNVAARVQGLTREVGYGVLITSQTYACVKDKIPAIYRGSFPVKGRTQPVEVYGVGEPLAGPASPDHDPRTLGRGQAAPPDCQML